MELQLHHDLGTGAAMEIALWGAVLYLLLFALFHFVLRNQVLPFGIGESLVVVLIADAAQSVMAGEAVSIADSALLAGGMLLGYLAVRMVYALRHGAVRYMLKRRGDIVVR